MRDYVFQRVACVFCLAALCPVVAIENQAIGQQPYVRIQARSSPTLGLDQGFIELDTPDFNLKLVKASQTVAALAPKGAGGFDFTPSDQLTSRARDGYFHLGDLTLRVRTGDSGSWQSLSTAATRRPVTALATSAPVLAAADLTPTLPASCPLQITRLWTLDGGRLVLRFDLRNETDRPVQIGALGIAMVFNNIITRRSLEQAHEVCSFSDPYVGLDGGYLQVTRLSGSGPALIVTPEEKTPFEAYHVLQEPTAPSQTFEGSFEWLVHTQAYAENEWHQVNPWNSPTRATLAPGETRSYGVRFLVADEIRHIESTLAANSRPVAVGIPGYILPMDLDGRLFLNYGGKAASLRVEPQGAIEWAGGVPTRGGWKTYTLHGRHWGRARLTVTYEDGLEQSIHYYVTKSAAQAVADLGDFLFNKQWFVDPNDPFGRSPSVMSYDRQADRILMQDSRVWIAGLGDEAGSGSWLAAAMKLFGQPTRDQVDKYMQFVDGVLWGGIQYGQGENMYGVRKSMFYYQPSEMPSGYYDSRFNWGSWTSWNKIDAQRIDRAYNYPHVAAAYWSMYRLARNSPALVTNHSWDWYLDHAYQTARFLTDCDAHGTPRVGYLNTGLMEGDIFVMLLKDLQREGWQDKAADLEARMKVRADRWSQEAYPFGSEMAWDSTGQEEVYAWCKYFGYDDKALVALNSILGYMPTVPHWGYNGNARRYWDFLYGGAPGATSRIERQIHHYGSGINAIPVLARYREQPDDYYLLRIGYGGMMGALSNIDQQGFASAAFHSFPDTLRWDAYSGDYGPNFFGHAVNTGTYIIDHPEFGWQAFGGNVQVEGDTVKVTPLDSFRKRIYVAPLGVWLTLDAGTFEAVEIPSAGKTVRLGLAAATQYTATALLRIEQPAAIAGVGTLAPATSLATRRGAFEVPLAAATAWVELR
jgi:hypothetical protein